MHLDFRGTGDVLAAEQDGGLKWVASGPRIISIAEGMRKTSKHSLQVQAQFVIFFDGISSRQRLEKQVIVIGRLSSGGIIDLFKLSGRRIAEEKSSFVDFSDPEKRIRTRTVLSAFIFPAQIEKAFHRGL